MWVEGRGKKGRREGVVGKEGKEKWEKGEEERREKGGCGRLREYKEEVVDGKVIKRRWMQG